MLLNFVQRMDLQAVWVVGASDLCQREDVREFRSLQRIEKLFAILHRLLAVTALLFRLLPALDACLAVYGALAEIAVDWLHPLWHNDLLTDDTEGVRVQIELRKLFPVLNAVFDHVMLRSASFGCSFVQGGQSHSSLAKCLVE